jgi:hypothetical protein
MHGLFGERERGRMWVNFEKALVLKNIKIKDDVMICANIYNRMFPLKMDLRFLFDMLSISRVNVRKDTDQDCNL